MGTEKYLYSKCDTQLSAFTGNGVYEFSVFLIVGDSHNFENENAFIVRTG